MAINRRSAHACMLFVRRPKLGLLRRYAFPGNIMELRDLVERAAVQAGEAAPQLNADLFWFATQASLAECLCLGIAPALLKRCLYVSFPKVFEAGVHILKVIRGCPAEPSASLQGFASEAELIL